MSTSFGATSIPNDSIPQDPKENIGRGVDQRSAPTDSMITIRLSDTPKVIAEGQPSFENNGISGHDLPSRDSFEEEVPLQSTIRVGKTDLDRDDYSGEGYDKLMEQSSRTFSTSSSGSSHTEEPILEPRFISEILRRDSLRSTSSSEGAHVDWEELDKNEEEEQRDEGSDASTKFLLARLEQENNALATNPKANASKSRSRSRTRPPSIQELRKLVNEPTQSSLRYTLLPSPPPMTELEFWSALVTDYRQTAQRLPTLTSNKIRNGVPAPLRGLVWLSIAGARDRMLEDEYDRLCGESSPYEKLIGKDIGRSFPGVDMFRDPKGEGQKMLGKVLKAFSLWDQEIGYCQGLGFVVGPLLMHMGDKEAFCVLVRLMRHYDLRSCFLPDLSGLHLRIYQFQHLLGQHLPELTAHLDNLKLEPLYLSQWFLSFFGVTCPLPMLLRIYDVILTEGASETLMRVALSLMRRNEKKILATTEFEDIMQLLLSRGLWDTYGCNADELVNDFCGLTGLVTRDSLQSLEMNFKDANNEDAMSPVVSKPNVHSAASRFLGRFWAGSSTALKANTSNSALSAPARPLSSLRRTPSKQSMASTLNSVESAESSVDTSSTDATNVSRQMSADWVPVKQTLTKTGTITTTRVPPSNKDKDLHIQIEDLLTALSDMQREQTLLASELQREREERDEDRNLVREVISRIKKQESLTVISEDDGTSLSKEYLVSDDITESFVALEESFTVLEEHFTTVAKKRSSILQTKHQLREDATLWKDQYNEEAARSADLTRQLTERDREAAQVKEQLRDARSRLQENSREKQRLEKSIQDLKNRKSSGPPDSPDTPTSATSEYAPSPGLREFKLGRLPPVATAQSGPVFSKRMSSLSTQSVLATPDLRPVGEEALLLELVNSKTAEAIAKQELEEVKGKLDSLRKLLGGTPASPGAAGGSPGVLYGPPVKSVQDPPKPAPANASSGGFFSGWGKRAVSGPTNAPDGR